MADLMQQRNDEVAELAAARRYRTERRGDGEIVIRLPGKHGAHAGRWGAETSYLLTPCSQPSRRVSAIRQGWPAMTDHSGDAELLMLGPNAVVESILASGPTWARARRRNSPQSAERILPFSRRRRDSDAGPPIEAEPVG